MKRIIRTFLRSILVALALYPFAPSQAAQVSARDFDLAAAQAERARKENRVEDAIELYRKALNLRSSWAEGWWYLGTLLYERDSYANASVALQRAVALRPDAATAWVLLGLCEFKLGRHAAALEHIRHGRRLGAGEEPQLRPVMLYHEGLLLLGKGDFEGAQETLGVLSAEGVESDEVVVALGLAVLRTRFSELLAGGASIAELARRAGRAERLAAQKRFDEALGEYERLASDFPKTPNVQYAFGRFLLTNSYDERAVAAFLREIENAPDHLQARLLIADTKLRRKEFNGGLPFAEEASKLSPNLPLARYLLGSLLTGAGRATRAVEELETAARLKPDEPKILFALSRAYERAGRKEDARRALDAFARLKKDKEGSGAEGLNEAPVDSETKPVRRNEP